jgi:hypothetical protein
MSVDIPLFVHELLSSIGAAVNKQIENYKPNLTRAIGILPPKSLPVLETEAQGTTVRSGLLKLANPGEATEGRAVAADDPRLAAANPVEFTTGEINAAGDWASGNEGFPPLLTWSLDRGRVYIEGMIGKAVGDMESGDIMLTAASAAIRPTVNSYGFILVNGVPYLIVMGVDGTLTYVGGTVPNDIGAPVFLTYRVA